MQRVTIHHEATKGLRINRFARPYIELVTRDEFDGWASDYEKFTSPSGKIIFVKRKWEAEKLAKGEICYSNSCWKSDGLSSFVQAFQGVYSVKAALRQIRKYAHLFPTGTTFRDFAGWVGHGVSFVIRNDEYDEENVKEVLYKDLTLGKRFFRVSDNEQFNKLTLALRNAGYLVAVFKDCDYWQGYIRCNNIRAGFCTESESAHCSLSGKFCAENEECFDKWSKCPVQIDFPKTQEEIELLIKELEYLASEEGCEASNSFEYEYKFIK